MSPIWQVAKQGTGQWLKSRVGCLTASRMRSAMSFLKNGNSSEDRNKLMIEIVAERLSDVSTETYVTPAMQWGLDHEDDGKSMFEEKTGILLMPCGFALHDTIDFFGASPDALIGHDTVFEMKAPTTTTHIKWIADGVVPEVYRPQILAQLAVTGRTKSTFMSYDPRVPENVQLFIRNWEPTANEISNVEQQAITFLAEVDRLFDKVIENAA